MLKELYQNIACFVRFSSSTIIPLLIVNIIVVIRMWRFINSPATLYKVQASTRSKFVVTL